MALSDIVTVSITTTSVNLQLPGFGIPLILSFTTLFTDRIRFYTDLAGMVTDGFSTSGPEYKAATALLAQNPRIKKFAIGRRALKPAPHWTLFATVANLTAYKMYINDVAVTYTSDASATATEIYDGLKTAIDALSLALTVTDNGPGTNLGIVTTATGAWFSIRVDDPATLSIVMDHADAGIATDMAAIQVIDNTWYGIINPWGATAEVTALAAWAEANSKLYVQASQETLIISSAAPGSDIAGSLKTANYFRTKIMYHQNPAQFADAAWVGKMFPYAPGSATWELKTLAGVSTTSLTSTQRTNLVNKNCGFYENVAGVALTQNSKVAAGEWIDVMVGRDWLASDLQARILTLLASNAKVPYTDPGIQAVAAEVKASLNAAIDAGILAQSPAPVVTVPKAADVSSADKAARTLNNVRFDATLAGAIHAVSVTGSVHV